jgi:hypothetical protein
MKLYHHLPFILLMLIMSLLGMKSYRTYGTQWDEYLQRNMGRVSYNYIANGNDSLLTLNGRDYGIVVELPLYALEKKFAPNQVAESIYLRHLACFFLYCFGVIVFYLTLLKLKFNPIGAFCGVLMLVVSPRIFGHAFINSKDVPLMVFYIFSFFSLLYFIEKPSIKRSLFHAFTCALLIDTRITGVIIVPITIFFFTLYEYQKSSKKYSKILGINLLVQLKYYFIFCALLIYIFWPYLWLNPIKNFLVAFLNMSHYRWKGYSLLFGDFIFSYQTPWYFALAWIAITTPILYLIMFLLGIYFMVLQIIKEKALVFKNIEFLEILMPFCLFTCPILAIIVLKSVLYDTWRHIYFVYPFLLLTGMYGAKYVVNKVNRKPLKWAAFALFFSLVGIELIKMIKAYPHEYVYFNELVSGSKNNIRLNYDMDYWGTGFKYGLQKVLDMDHSDTIKITGNVYPCYSNYVLLKDNNPKCRLQYVLTEKEADYYLTNYRYKPNDHFEKLNDKVFDIQYRNSEILGVYKVKK